MKIPIVTAQLPSQRLKKSIWQPNASRDLPQKKGSTVLNVYATKVNARPVRNPQSCKENKISPKTANNSMKIRKQKKEESENVIVDVLEQLQSYENVPITNTSRKNSNPFSAGNSDKKTQRSILGDISNTMQHNNNNNSSFSQIMKQKSLNINGSPINHNQQKNTHRSQSFIESINDDENDREISQKLQIQCQQIVNSLTQHQNNHHHSQHLSSTSTNASSTSTVGIKPARCSAKSSHPQKIEIETQSLQSCSARQDQSNTHNNLSLQTQSSEGNISALKHDYLEGYKVYQKQEKLFTFKIFKEDFLKIPAEFSKVIIHSQDDDVSSDDDVVRGGVKFNYKSILKEVYEEHELPTAPILNVHHLHFM